MRTATSAKGVLQRGANRGTMRHHRLGIAKMTGRVAMVPLARALALAPALGADTRLRELKIPLEDGVASWPPDGLVPPSAEI